ncbi:hypothetical protein KWW89_18600 [Clostridioides difficile]|nr:hypothetical protein [Clostridioides difficile]HEL7585452.1 hypothetical protein [Clostridioides difficile]
MTRKEKIEKTSHYLEDLGNRKRKINILKKEIAILKENEKYSEVNFNELGFKVKTSPKGLDEMIANAEQQILMKEAEIEHVERKMELIYAYLEELPTDERRVIELMYFYSRYNRMSMTEIMMEVNCCKSQLYRKRDSALGKLSDMLLIF